MRDKKQIISEDTITLSKIESRKVIERRARVPKRLTPWEGGGEGGKKKARRSKRAKLYERGGKNNLSEKRRLG